MGNNPATRRRRSHGEGEDLNASVPTSSRIDLSLSPRNSSVTTTTTTTTKTKIRQRYSVLVGGMDGAGKTTVVFFLQTGKAVTTVPTVSFDSIKLKHADFKFFARDLGAQTLLYHLWPTYYKEATGVVWVVDSGSSEKAIRRSGRVLEEMLTHPDMGSSVPLLILANKQDLSWARNSNEVTQLLRIEEFANGREWTVVPTCGVSGKGLGVTRDRAETTTTTTVTKDRDDDNDDVRPFRWLYASIARSRTWSKRMSLSPKAPSVERKLHFARAASDSSRS
eukprot:g1806.t1